MCVVHYLTMFALFLQGEHVSWGAVPDAWPGKVRVCVGHVAILSKEGRRRLARAHRLHGRALLLSVL